jgi:secondary thiamine-phosphate synthase enzyme
MQSVNNVRKTMWFQHEFLLAAQERGFHLITEEVLQAIPAIKQINCGLLHLFIKHTSASLTLSENADPTVRLDLESHFNHFVPENAAYYRHDYEGDDDMPAHIKNCILGSSLTLPVSNGRLNLGIWQGIYLCEHRNHAGKRQLLATLYGEGFQ